MCEKGRLMRIENIEEEAFLAKREWELHAE